MGQAASGRWAKVPAAIAASLGAGAPLAIGPAAAAAGWWSLAALALAGLVALLTAASFADLVRQSGVDGSYAHVKARLGIVPGRLAGVLELTGRVAAAAAVAGAVGAYLLPARPGVAAMGLVAVVTAAVIAGVRPSPAVVTSAAFVIILTVALVVAACLAIDPVRQVTAPEPGAVGSTDPTGVLTAAGVLFFGFLGVERAGGGRARVGAVAVGGLALAYLLLAFAALRQLGGARLAFSPTPLRDALAAADGAALDPLVTVGLAVGAVLALRGLIGGAARLVDDMSAAGDLPAVPSAYRAAYRTLLPGAAAAGVAATVAPVPALAAAAALTLGAFAFVNAAARTLARAQRSTWVRTGCCGLALCVVVGVNISVTTLASAAGVLVLGAAASTLSARRARTATPG
ncbi:basic amino acid/polyamine antiporter, APA family [Actinokineospora iranica]|uniref:Basic amino acid/polyamine antiporter, APA family n=2 Tax=Actinokineospora iranica TaxID=1271860 RepID=A0A1G6MY83_9PSEU|nr:basic amino acid/polyamine antiporter, APA family [Actinokineospora iranica]